MASALAIRDFLILLFGAYGLGIGMGGLRLLSGALLIPIALFFAGIWFHVPPTVGARLLLLVAVARLGFEALRRDWRKLIHPALLLPTVHFVALFLFVRKPFTLHAWDEFSHWGLMPKQILLFDQVTSIAFPYDRFLDYTPGWPLLLDFPQLVQGLSYRTDHLIFAVVLLSSAVAAGVWDLVRWKTSSSLCAWAAALAVSRLYLGGCLYPTGIMSEFPLDAVYCATALLGLRYVLGQRDEHRDPMMWGVVLCGGYLIKKSFLGTLVIFLWLSLDSIRKDRSPRRVARILATTWVPFLAALATWQLVSRDYPHVFKFVSNGGISVPMIAGMIRQSAEFLGFYWYLSAIAAAGFALGLRDNKTRSFFGALLVYAAAYLVGLYWLYRTTFPGAEGEQLASFRRYFQSLFGPCLFAAVVFLFARFSDRVLAWRKAWIAAVVILALANLEQLQLSIVMMKKYGAPSRVVAQAPALIHLLEMQGWRGREVWMLYEGEGGIVNWQAIYASIDRAGPRAFTTSPIFDPAEGKVPTARLGEELSRQTVVWPVAVSKATEQALAGLMKAPHSCPADLTGSFWVRESSGHWTCVPKS